MTMYYVHYKRKGNFSTNHIVLKDIHPIWWVSTHKQRDLCLVFFCEIPREYADMAALKIGVINPTEFRTELMDHENVSY